MIEISHKQAQYLIRQAADKRLPEEQWAALQAHLERCPACRGYRDRLAGMDRALRRALLARWRPADPTTQGLARSVIAYRRRRGENRRSALYGLFGLVAAALIILISLPGWVPARSAASVPPTATAAPLPTATEEPKMLFRGLVAYAARGETGDSEIYLLNATPNERELTNLTNNPAEETNPVWSPDGEWLAFLSDRSGKNEIYVIGVAGTGLVQLTNEPGIYWQEPLSWSHDGRWIALTGKRLDQNVDAYTYLVPLDGRQPPVSLPGTRSQSQTAVEVLHRMPPLFSPRLPLLASVGPDGRIQVTNTATGRTAPVLDMNSLNLTQIGTPAYPYDWGAGGDSLVYIGSPQGDIRRQSVIPAERTRPPAGGDAVVEVPAEGRRFRSVIFQQDGLSVATLKDEAGSGCWTVHLYALYLFETPRERAFLDLCVSADLQPANWTNHSGPARENWLVVSARELLDREEPTYAGAEGLYALLIPTRPNEEPASLFERLADLPAGEAPIPQVRPVRASLGIQPQAAATTLGAAPAERKTARLPGGLTGRLLLLKQNSTIATLRPDGLDPKDILSLGSTNSCPTWSPDRTKVAFLSDRGSNPSEMLVEGVQQTGPSEIFVLDAVTGEVKQLTDAMLTGRAAMGLMQGYSCPSWSPDGKYLAVTSYVGQGSGLMVMTPAGQVVRYGVTDRSATYANLVWTADGQSIIMAQPKVHGNAPRIVLSSWRTTAANRSLLILNGWDDIQALSLSPDGKQLAFILYRQPTADQPGEGVVRVVSFPDLRQLYEKPLPGYDARLLHSPGHIAWMQEGQIVFAIPQSPLAHNKALLARYTPASDTVQYLASSEDALYDWALKGSWLVYSSESGLWGIPVNGPLDTGVAPFRLSTDPALRVDWK